MKMTLKITSAVALIVGIVAVSSGAFATDTREAIKMCDKNPKCKMTSAGIDFIILHVHGGGTVVCPMINGPCQTRTSGNRVTSSG